MSSVQTGNAIFSLSNCSCNSGAIENKLRALNGVKSVNVDFVANAIEVDYDPALLTSEMIRDFLSGLKFGVRDKHIP
jgi:copper chaperone CopZ